jgi:hypothetical protein
MNQQHTYMDRYTEKPAAEMKSHGKLREPGRVLYFFLLVSNILLLGTFLSSKNSCGLFYYAFVVLGQWFW